MDVERAIQHLLKLSADLHAKAEMRHEKWEERHRKWEARQQQAEARMDRLERQMAATWKFVRRGARDLYERQKQTDRQIKALTDDIRRLEKAGDPAETARRIAVVDSHPQRRPKARTAA